MYPLRPPPRPLWCWRPAHQGWRRSLRPPCRPSCAATQRGGFLPQSSQFGCARRRTAERFGSGRRAPSARVRRSAKPAAQWSTSWRWRISRVAFATPSSGAVWLCVVPTSGQVDRTQCRALQQPALQPPCPARRLPAHRQRARPRGLRLAHPPRAPLRLARRLRGLHPERRRRALRQQELQQPIRLLRTSWWRLGGSP